MNKDRIVKLSSGATLIYGKTRLCDATAVEVGFCAGAYYEKVKGTAHLLEHTLFKKTKNRSNAEVEKDRGKIAKLNASTGMDFLSVNFYRTNKLIKEAFEFASDVLLNSAVDDEYLKSEKEVVKEEFLMCADGESRDVYVQNFRQALPNVRFASDIVGGSLQNIDKIKFKDLTDFKNKYFVSSNFVCSVVSPLSIRKIKRLVEETFVKKLPISSTSIKPEETHYFNCNVGKNSSINLIKNSQDKISVLISFKMNVGEKQIYTENYNYLFLTKYVSGAQGDLFLKLRNSGLIYKLDCDISSFEKTSLFNIIFETSKEKVGSIVEIISDEVRQILNGKISEGDAEIYKKNLDFLDDEKLPLKTKARCHSNFTDYLSFKEVLFLSKKQRRVLKDNVSAHSVTEIAREIFNAGNEIYVTVLGDIDKKDVPSLKEFKEKFLIWESNDGEKRNGTRQ